MTKKPIPHLRWYIAVLLCLSTSLNYLDRQTLSVLADTIQRELNLTTADYAKITSAFLMSYAVMYAVGGKLIDVMGTRLGMIVFVSLWSVANMLHGFASTLNQLRFFRFLLGAAEPANFPAGVKAVTEWFPMRERALGVGIFNAGTAVGSAISIPLVSWLALRWGWQSAFVVTGAIGFVWVIVWVVAYRLPQDHPRLGAEELALIQAGDEAEPPGAPPVPLARLLRMKATWGCIAARVLTDPISYFLFFWTPKYFQMERGFDLKQVGFSVWIPFVALTIGSIAGGAIPRVLVARGWTVNRARKTTMGVISALMPLFCYLVTRVDSPAMAVVLMSAVMFCHTAWGNITLPAEVFPKHVVATVSGLGGALGGVVGALTQKYIAIVVDKVSFAPLFAACGIIYVLAFVVVGLLVGRLGVIRAMDAKARARA